MPPEVTAVITTHVRPLHVFEAVASVRAEAHKDVEIVVVDDGGTLSDAGSDVRIVRGEALGVGRARNLGLDAARGEFVIFLDDDDVALPHRITTLLGAARSSGADMCFGLTRRVAGTAVPLDPVPTCPPSAGAVTFADVLTCNPHINAVLVRTETLRAVGGFDAEGSRFAAWSACLRLAKRGAAIRKVADVVAEWRLHGSGLSGQVANIRAMRARLIALFDRLEPCLFAENGRAVAGAREVVRANEMPTYDDYVDAMMEARQAPHLPIPVNYSP